MRKIETPANCRDRGCVDEVWGRLRCPGAPSTAWMRCGGACAVLVPSTMRVWFMTNAVLRKTHVGTGAAWMRCGGACAVLVPSCAILNLCPPYICGARNTLAGLRVKCRGIPCGCPASWMPGQTDAHLNLNPISNSSLPTTPKNLLSLTFFWYISYKQYDP